MTGEKLNLDRLMVANAFTYHVPIGNQQIRYEEIRFEAKDLALKIFDLCPESEEKSLAIEKLREAVMWANASIACNEFRTGEDA